MLFTLSALVSSTSTYPYVPSREDAPPGKEGRRKSHTPKTAVQVVVRTASAAKTDISHLQQAVDCFKKTGSE